MDSLHEQCVTELDLHIRSNRPLVYIVSHEERRILSALRDICVKNDRGWRLLSWDIDLGLKVEEGEFNISKEDTSATTMQDGVLPWFRDLPTQADSPFTILVLKDFHKFTGAGDARSGQAEKMVCRQLRNLSAVISGTRKTMVMVGPTLVLPEELQKSCAVIDWPLPERADIQREVRDLIDAAWENPRYKDEFHLEYSAQDMDDIVSAFLGLTIDETRLMVPYMLQSRRKLDAKAIASKKREIIRKSGVLEWVEPNVTMSQIGGLSNLKTWLAKRKKGFTPNAAEYGLSLPKGIFLLGVQGSGKSAVSKAAADSYGMPLLKMDVGSLYGSLLGESEAKVRLAIKTAESVAPCILWADEIEKGFGGSRSGRTDSGTSARVLATFLTWLAEKTSPVFIVATANDVTSLPPEIIRKGRFDEIFFVDLPQAEEREQILAIHIAKRRREPSKFDLRTLAKLADEFSGAELEQAVESAMFDAFDQDREFDTSDIARAITESVPLAKTMGESIQGLREWIVGRARMASDGRLATQESQKTSRTVQPSGSTILCDDDEHL